MLNCRKCLLWPEILQKPDWIAYSWMLYQSYPEMFLWIVIWRSEAERANNICQSKMRHISKHFLLPDWKRSRVVKRLRVPFKTNPVAVNHRAFRPIPERPFFKTRFARCAFILQPGLVRSILLPRLLPQIKRVKWTAWDAHQLSRTCVRFMGPRGWRPRPARADDTWRCNGDTLSR